MEIEQTMNTQEWGDTKWEEEQEHGDPDLPSCSSQTAGDKAPQSGPIAANIQIWNTIYLWEKPGFLHNYKLIWSTGNVGASFQDTMVGAPKHTGANEAKS